MRLNFLFGCMLIGLLQSCKDEIEMLENQSRTEVSAGSEQIRLGATVAMPYSLKNVQAAYDSLMQESPLRSSSGSEQLKATHYYVRFLPKDSTDFATLLSDTSIVLFETPFDREIEGEGGDSFHDPTLNDGAITWQYTKVPVDYKFPNVKYEILDEMYILPEFELTEEGDDDDEIEKMEVEIALRSGMAESFAKILQKAALTRVGYIQEKDTVQESPLRSIFSSIVKKVDPTWTPKANIFAWDDLLEKYIPLKGVKVYICHGGVWAYRTTDKDGYVKLPKCVGPVIYKIEWSDTYWQIYDGSFLPAYYSRSGTNRSTWNLKIGGGNSLHYACIHRAARRHLYENNCGIDRPRHFHRICYYDKEGTGSYWADMSAYAGGSIPDILIYGYEGGYKKTYKLFSTTCHELGHAQHCLGMGRVQFWQVSKIIYESWADCVAWALANQEYDEYNVARNKKNLLDGLNNNQNDWPSKKNKEYSPLFIDLVDDFNQKATYNDSKYPNDQIFGYTMSTLNKILKKSYGLSSLKSNLKSGSKPSGVTNAKIDLLFKKYEEIW